MNSLISIIIPVYNAEYWLEECLNSVINQTYANLEIILVDDGSSDNSGRICDEYATKDKRIKVIHTENRGVSSARNTGLDLAQGDYVSFIDSDDFVDKDYIFAMHQKSIETNAGLVFCHYSKFVEGKTIPIDEKIPELINVNIKDDNFLYFIHRFFNFNQSIFGGTWRVLFKENILHTIKFVPDIKVSEDLLFLLHVILKAKRIASVKEHLYFYRQTNHSVTSKYKKNFLSSQLSLYRELKKIFDAFDNVQSKQIFETYSCLLCYYLFSNEVKFKQQNRRNNIKEIRESALYKHFCLKNGLKIYGLKNKLKFLIIWMLVKIRIV